MRRKKLAAGLVAITTGMGVMSGSPAQAAFTAYAGPTFNNPQGTIDDQMAIMNRLMANIDAAPNGSAIRIAIYSISIRSFADKLVAAHHRGVQVQILMDSHGAPGNAAWTALGDLNKHRWSGDGSFARTCSYGCLTGSKSSGASLHAKYYLFSTAGSSKKVVVVSSANPTGAQAWEAWNNSYSVVGNVDLYNSYVKYFADMTSGAAGHHNTNYFRTYGFNPKAYFWPDKSGSTDAVYADLLNKVKCPSAVRVVMFEWSTGRMALAKKLVSLGAAGCSVDVLETSGAYDSDVRKELSGKKNVHVYDTSIDANGDGFAEHYTHNKYVIIDGTFDGVKGRKVVLAGSENFTTNAQYHNDESDVRVMSTAAYNGYYQNFCNELAAVPRNSMSIRRAEGDAPVIKLTPQQLADS